jgi:sugar phosphate isomerase/epimerase
VEIASNFFFTVAERVACFDITLCIEPNPVEYECDFIITSTDALALVKQVDHPNFRLHLDTSAIFLNREDPTELIPHCLPYLHHFHISEPFLGLIGDNKNDHLSVAKSLHKSGYDGWISIEMRSGLMVSSKDAIQHALVYVKKIYMEQ